MIGVKLARAKIVAFIIKCDNKLQLFVIQLCLSDVLGDRRFCYPNLIRPLAEKKHLNYWIMTTLFLLNVGSWIFSSLNDKSSKLETECFVQYKKVVSVFSASRGCNQCLVNSNSHMLIKTFLSISTTFIVGHGKFLINAQEIS